MSNLSIIEYTLSMVELQMGYIILGSLLLALAVLVTFIVKRFNGDLWDFIGIYLSTCAVAQFLFKFLLG